MGNVGRTSIDLAEADLAVFRDAGVYPALQSVGCGATEGVELRQAGQHETHGI